MILCYSRLNIYYRLTPFLLLYLTICIVFDKNVLRWDEEIYLWFSDNLIHGFYSPPYPGINLWNGPGYPAFLAPFKFFNPPLIGLRLLNGLLLYFSLIISYKTLSFYSSRNSSFLYTILLGLYFPIFEMLPLTMTECLSWFLVSLVCFLFIKTFNQKHISWKHLLLTAFAIAYLAMTKVIFGYVIFFMLIVSICLFFVPAFRSSAKKAALIYLIAFFFCLPWLFYTYSLTNKIFYWTNAGGMTLYTMSTPYINELGDWKDSDQLRLDPNHTYFMERISKLTPIEKDDAYKAAALMNIKSHPSKYLSNWIANVGRLLFSYPYSHTEQTIKSYFTIIPNMFVIVAIVFACAVSIVHYKKLPKGLIFLLLFVSIYLFGSTLVSTYRRMFFITMPFWLFFISYVFSNIIYFKINNEDVNIHEATARSEI